MAASSPAPKFYVTPRHALCKYNEYKRTGSVKRVTEETQRMYQYIFDMYEKALENSNGVVFKYSVMQNVLDSPAPSFFLCPSAAYAFYCRAMEYKRKLSRKK